MAKGSKFNISKLQTKSTRNGQPDGFGLGQMTPQYLKVEWYFMETLVQHHFQSPGLTILLKVLYKILYLKELSGTLFQVTSQAKFLLSISPQLLSAVKRAI